MQWKMAASTGIASQRVCAKILESVLGDSITTAFDFIPLNSCGRVLDLERHDQSKKLTRSQSDKQRRTRSAENKRTTPVYAVCNAFRRVLGASVCVRVVGDVPGSRGPLLSSCGHENHADVYVFAWMAGKCVS